MSSSPTFLDPIVINLLRGGSVLDVGCGYGRWGNLIRSNSWEAGIHTPPQVDGIDAFAPNVEFCAGQGTYHKVWHHLLPAPLDGKWDTVLACEVIEHLQPEDVDRAFAVLEAAASQRVILSTPNFPDFRPGGDTLTGRNEYEAHHSYISRDEFSRRGYKLIGAGFGYPGCEFSDAVHRLDPALIDILQSVSRAFPALATSIVAYKDVDATGAEPGTYRQSLERLTMADLRIAAVAGGTLAYDPVQQKFVAVDNLSSASPIFVMRGDAHAYAVSVGYGVFTFMPHEVVHCPAPALNAWELLNLQATIVSSHGIMLNRYCSFGEGPEITLVAPPLSMLLHPWFRDLLRLLDPFDARFISDASTRA
ncbi:MAG TPA: methyltransferase domain-containing protein [Acetobacteraceae bacterium]|nr:methyltransferase domain-containing protein [Acetobacteraceae bacterium]